MKQLLSITLLFSLTVLFTASSCKKQKNNEPQLPPETQTGANTLGFKINGKVYTASGKGGLLSNESVWGGPNSDTSITIGADNSIQKFALFIKIQYSGNIGTHYTNEYPYTGLIQLDTDTGGTIPTGSNTYNTTHQYKGKVNIKFSNGSINPLLTGTIVSGTFEMEAINSEGKVIKITDGRFDIGR